MFCIMFTDATLYRDERTTGMSTQTRFPFTTPGAVDLNDPECRAKFDEVLAELDELWEPYVARFRDSERLTEKDFALRFTNFD